MKRRTLLLAFIFAAAANAATTFDPAQFKSLQWREVGPFRGGRVAAVEGIVAQPKTYYFGGTGGGVWKTLDGGETWKNVSDGFFGGSIGAVAVSEGDPNVVYAGGGDLAMDPTNPRILFASTWRVRRTPYSLESGGEGSALWKSTDGGDTWKNISTNKGMPKGTLGIIGVSISPSNPQNVYAIIEAEQG